MKMYHQFEFGILEFHETHAVITCNENVEIGFTEIKEIQEVLYSQYKGVKFGMIANRKFHYAVDPLAINKLFSHEDLVAGAIVSLFSSAAHNAEVEDMFVEGAPIRYFQSMQVAEKWISGLVESLSHTPTT